MGTVTGTRNYVRILAERGSSGLNEIIGENLVLNNGVEIQGLLHLTFKAEGSGAGGNFDFYSPQDPSIIVRTTGAANSVHLDLRPVGADAYIFSRTASRILYLGAGAVDSTDIAITPSGNMMVGASTTFGTNADTVFGIKTGTAPTTAPADIIQIYSADGISGSTTFNVFCEAATVSAIGIASTHKIPVLYNGTLIYLMASNV